MFIKDRPVSSLGVFVFEFLGSVSESSYSSFFVLRKRSTFECFVFDRCFVFEIWVLRFRVLGASFLRFGCFVLRSSFSSAPFSKLPT